MSDSSAEAGAIFNRGTLNVNESIIANNSITHLAGAILNDGGTVVVQDSTTFNNEGDGPGGIGNRLGQVLLRNSAIISIANLQRPGGGIGNSGSMEIVNSTIAKNEGLQGGGGGIFNAGLLLLRTARLLRMKVLAWYRVVPQPLGSPIRLFPRLVIVPRQSAGCPRVTLIFLARIVFWSCTVPLMLKIPASTFNRPI